MPAERECSPGEVNARAKAGVRVAGRQPEGDATVVMKAMVAPSLTPCPATFIEEVSGTSWPTPPTIYGARPRIILLLVVVHLSSIRFGGAKKHDDDDDEYGDGGGDDIDNDGGGRDGDDDDRDAIDDGNDDHGDDGDGDGNDHNEGDHHDDGMITLAYRPEI